MAIYNYPSEICEYCICTDFGLYPVGTGLHNLCEGQGCVDAYENYIEEHPEDNRELEEMF